MNLHELTTKNLNNVKRLMRIDVSLQKLIYLCTEIKKRALKSGHRNSRQAKVAFSKKRNEPLCEGEGLQRYGYFPDFDASRGKN